MLQKISDIQIIGQNIIWYDDSGNVLNTATPLIDGTTYYASKPSMAAKVIRFIQLKVATPLPMGNAKSRFLEFPEMLKFQRFFGNRNFF